MFFRKGFLKNFAKLTGAEVSFLIKVQARPCNFIKNETLAQVFSCKSCKISKTPFSQNTPALLLLCDFCYWAQYQTHKNLSRHLWEKFHIFTFGSILHNKISPKRKFFYFLQANMFFSTKRWENIANCFYWTL